MKKLNDNLFADFGNTYLNPDELKQIQAGRGGNTHVGIDTKKHALIPRK